MGMQAITDCSLDTVHLHWRHKDAVRKMLETKSFAAHAHKALDVFVPWRDVGIAHRPINADGIARIRFEIEITPAIDLPPPDNGFATDLPRSKPIEWFAGGSAVRIIDVVCPEDVTELVEAHRLALELLSRVD